jgi:hypothetical protein
LGVVVAASAAGEWRVLGLAEAGDAWLSERTERARTLFQHGLSPKDPVELLLDLLVVEELARDHPVDLCAHFREAIFVGDLQIGLARDQLRDDLVVKSEVGRGDDRPAGHDHQRANDRPERDRTEADLTPRTGEHVTSGRPVA